MKRYLPFVLIALVAVIAVAAGTLLYRAKRTELARTLSDISATSDAGAQPPNIHGNAKAPVTIEEFGDFQCPPCSTIAVGLDKLEKDLGSQVRIIFRNFPLAMHNHAAEAARVAEAAGLQGKFWEMHALLYRNQNAWSREADVKPFFDSYAQTIGLDLARFQKDVESESVKNRIAADQKRGASLGVNSTPTLFLNGRQLPPTSFNDNAMRTAVSAALRGELPPPMPTPTPATPPPAILTPTSTPAP